MDSLGLAPDDVVADIGAGTGYFTFRIAERVPEGGVYAVDIQPEMLDIMEERAEAEGFDNVDARPGHDHDPNLPRRRRWTSRSSWTRTTSSRTRAR